MNAAIAIARREFAAVYKTPVGWITAALYALLTSLVFVLSAFAPGEPASLRYFFGPAGWLLAMVAPALSMRLFSEEFRAGSIELLRTAPISDPALVLGKYAGALLALIAMLIPTLAIPITLFAVSSPTPDAGPVLAGYAGLILLGGMYLAIGALCGSMTSSQTLAYLATLMIIMVALVATGPQVTDRLPAGIAQRIAQLSPLAPLQDFARGLIDTAHLVYYAAVSAAALTTAAARMTWRRWR